MEPQRLPNFTPSFLKSLAAVLGRPQTGPCGLPEGVTPEDIFHYTYAVFHSPVYRSRYAEFLKIDFPRLPLTSNLTLFRTLASLGVELVAFHLAEAPVQHALFAHYDSTAKMWSYNVAKGQRLPITLWFNGPEKPVVEKVGWSDDTVWIDARRPQKGIDTGAVIGTVGFYGVPEAVWNFHIGGYQVCEKWLKDRKGRNLSKEDIEHYHRVVVALSETIRLMQEIDAVIERHGGWLGAFQTGKTIEPAERILKVAQPRAEHGSKREVTR